MGIGKKTKCQRTFYLIYGHRLLLPLLPGPVAVLEDYQWQCENIGELLGKDNNVFG